MQGVVVLLSTWHGPFSINVVFCHARREADPLCPRTEAEICSGLYACLSTLMQPLDSLRTATGGDREPSSPEGARNNVIFKIGRGRVKRPGFPFLLIHHL